jgi:predicted RNase H-like HicB family nuclease
MLQIRQEVITSRPKPSLKADEIEGEPMSINFAIEIEREDDGRWIAEIPTLPGVMAYGDTETEAVRSVHALAFHVLADKIAHDTAAAPERELVVCLACAR